MCVTIPLAIQFGSRSKILSGKVIQLKNAQYSSVRYGSPVCCRCAEVCTGNNQAPDSPQCRCVPQLMQPPQMQAQRPPIPPRALIARQQLDPTVDVSHKLTPFNMRYLFFFFSAKSDLDVFIVVQHIGSKNDWGTPVKQIQSFVAVRMDR